MKIRPWTEWHARTRDLIVGIKVRMTFNELAHFLGFRVRRKPRNPNPQPNPKSKHHDDLP